MAGRVLVWKKNLSTKIKSSMSILMQVPRKRIYCEASFFPGWHVTIPTNHKRKRSFAISQKLARETKPRKFESKTIEAKKAERLILTESGYKPFYKYCFSREWIDTETGEIILTDEFLTKYNWKWTGHYNTYYGRDYQAETKTKNGSKSKSSKSKQLQIDL